MGEQHGVIIPDGLKPEPHEVEIAELLALHYSTIVTFLKPIDSYKQKTPDIVMNGLEWEVKSPTGKSRQTIQKQIRRALKQSPFIIIDGRRAHIEDTTIKSKIDREMTKHLKVRRILFITKQRKIIEFKKRARYNKK